MPLDIFKERVLLIFIILSFSLLFFSLGLVYFNIRELSSPVIIHFDGLRDIDPFGKVGDLWFIWLTGFVIVLINVFFGNFFFYRERVLAYLILGTTLLFSILHLVALAQIISVN